MEINKYKDNVLTISIETGDWSKNLEYNNYKTLIQKFEELDKAWFHDTLFVIAWSDDPAGLSPMDLTSYSSFKRKILIYVGEEHGYGIPEELSNKFDYIFKNYLRKEDPDNHLYSYPLVTPDAVPDTNVVPFNERKYNVFYSGNLNKYRLKIMCALNAHAKLFDKIFSSMVDIKGGSRLFNMIYKGKTYNLDDTFPNSIIRFNNGFNTGFDKKTYAEITSNSKIILSPKGFYSPECFRLYEALRRGCVVITEPLPKVPFYEGIPAIGIANWADVIRVVNELLNDETKMDDLSAKSIQFYNRHLSLNSIAEYIYKRSSK